MRSVFSFDEFVASIKKPAPPIGLSPALEALWWDGKGNWDRGHKLLQDEGTIDQCRVHAYLHRKEGDDWNARYWYSRAEESFFKGALEAEWKELVERYLGEPVSSVQNS